MDEPKSDLAESRIVGRNQRALAEFGPEVLRVRVDDNLTGIGARAEALTDQLIETELLRSLPQDWQINLQGARTTHRKLTCVVDVSIGSA